MSHLIIEAFGNLTAVEVCGHSAQVAKPDGCFQCSEGLAHLMEALQVEEAPTGEASDSGGGGTSRPARCFLPCGSRRLARSKGPNQPSESKEGTSEFNDQVQAGLIQTPCSALGLGGSYTIN